MLDTNPEKVPYLRTGTYARTIWIIDINYYFSQKKKNMNYYFRKAKVLRCYTESNNLH
jgi:hypothetical protein